MKEIDGFPGYFITEDGRVWSEKSGKWMSQHKNCWGYFLVRLSRDGAAHGLLVHRLVAKSYLGEAEGKEQVNHIDGQKTNNCWKNLELCTQSENMRHAYRNGLKVTDNSAACRANRKKVICLDTKEVFNSMTDVAKYLDVSNTAITIAIKKAYRCGGSHWQYLDSYESNKNL